MIKIKPFLFLFITLQLYSSEFPEIILQEKDPEHIEVPVSLSSGSLMITLSNKCHACHQTIEPTSKENITQPRGSSILKCGHHVHPHCLSHCLQKVMEENPQLVAEGCPPLRCPTEFECRYLLLYEKGKGLNGNSKVVRKGFKELKRQHKAIMKSKSKQSKTYFPSLT